MCEVYTDNQNGTNYTLADSSCASSQGEDSGLVCQDVTSSKRWECANFFGAEAGSRAYAVFNYSTSGTAVTDTASFNLDALFYNVSYNTPPPEFFPQNSQAAINDSRIYQFETVQISANATDENEMSMVIFSWNATSNGAWINVSNTSVLSGQTSVNYTVNMSVTVPPGRAVGYVFNANDSDGNWASTGLKGFGVGGVAWNRSSLNLNGGYLKNNSASSARIFGYLNNTFVNASCFEGDCGRITSNFTMQDRSDTHIDVMFNCTNSDIGRFTQILSEFNRGF